MKGIFCSLATVVGIAAVPFGIYHFAAGHNGWAFLCLIAVIVFIGFVGVPRFQHNQLDVKELAKKIRNAKKEGYTANEAIELNKLIDEMKIDRRFDFLTFPWSEFKKIKKLDEKGTKPAPVATAKTSDSSDTTNYNEIMAKLEKFMDENSATSQGTEAKKESSDAPTPQTEAKKESSEAPAAPTEKKEEKPEESTGIIEKVFECEVITLPRTKFDESLRKMNEILADAKKKGE